jgi:excisionase family DNA binding protein
MERFLNIIELSQLLSVKTGTIYEWVHKDLIPYYKFNKLVRFRESEINEWSKAKKHKKNIVRINLV